MRLALTTGLLSVLVVQGSFAAGKPDPIAKICGQAKYAITLAQRSTKAGTVGGFIESKAHMKSLAEGMNAPTVIYDATGHEIARTVADDPPEKVAEYASVYSNLAKKYPVEKLIICGRDPSASDGPGARSKH